MGDLPRRDAHGRAATYWAGRQDALEEVYHRIESGDLATAAARRVEVGPAFAESARAGDLESGLLRVPRDSKLDSLLVETQMFLGKFADARAVLERIAASGTPAERLRAHIQLGRIANRLASYADARSILAEAVREASILSVPEVEGEALRALGGVERKLGDLPSALEHLERAAELLEHGSREKVRTLTDLGAVLIARGEHGRAKTRLLEAASSVRSGTREDAAIQINLGIVSSREGDARTARYEELARLYETQGRRGDAAPWRARADDLFARLQAGGPTRAVGP